MRKLLFLAIFLLVLFITPSIVSAQSISDGHTAREEAEGKKIWEKLRAKQLECRNLTDDNFETLGEYFMGQMAESSHEVMNNMMKQMMGEKGEQQMHVVMGKRMSSCDTSSVFPSSSIGFMPMMNMMMGLRGGGSPMMGYGGWNNMMGGFGLFGWLSMIIFWLLLILGVVALVKWLTTSGKTYSSKTPLEILKERYAKGEIDKKEFEQKKKDLE